MGKFNEYIQKATPADNDTMMIYDATSKANKLSPFSGIWNWIVGKLTNAVISKLETSNKSVIGALNELNGGAFLPKAELRTSADSAEPGAYRVTTEHPVDGETEVVLLCFKIFNNDWGLFTQFLIPRGGSYIKARTCWYKTWENWKKYDVGAIDELSSRVFVDTRNLSTFSININLSKDVYTSFLMYGATSRYNGFMYIVFIDVASEKRIVNFIKIADFAASRTFSGTYSDDTSTLTINANNTIWGGIKLLILK